MWQVVNSVLSDASSNNAVKSLIIDGMEVQDDAAMADKF